MTEVTAEIEATPKKKKKRKEVGKEDGKINKREVKIMVVKVGGFILVCVLSIWILKTLINFSNFYSLGSKLKRFFKVFISIILMIIILGVYFLILFIQ